MKTLLNYICLKCNPVTIKFTFSYIQLMKNTFVLMLFCMILTNAWAQTEQQNIIFEHKIDDNHSWQLGLAYVGYADLSIKYSGVAITPEYRIYFNKNAMSGLYVGPFLRYQNYTMTNDINATAKYTSFGGGVLLGRQWVHHKGFVLDVFAGPIYNAGNISNVSDASIFSKPGFGIDGFGIRAGIALGFGF
jgi:hypothetical protein